jgi:hypothetical protein
MSLTLCSEIAGSGQGCYAPPGLGFHFSTFPTVPLRSTDGLPYGAPPGLSLPSCRHANNIQNPKVSDIMAEAPFLPHRNVGMIPQNGTNPAKRDHSSKHSSEHSHLRTAINCADAIGPLSFISLAARRRPAISAETADPFVSGVPLWPHIGTT